MRIVYVQQLQQQKHELTTLMFADDFDKREKQRQSSHDYRVKQKQKFELLEQQVQQLSYENQQLKLQNQTNDKIIQQMCQNVDQIGQIVGRLHEHIIGHPFQQGEEMQNQQNPFQQQPQFYNPQKVFEQQSQQGHFSTITGTQSNSSIHMQQNSVQSGSFQATNDWTQSNQGSFTHQFNNQISQNQMHEDQSIHEPSFFYSFSNHGNIFVIIFFVMLILPPFLFPQYSPKQTSGNNKLKMLTSIPQLQSQNRQNQYVKLSLLENLIAQQYKQSNAPNANGLIVYAQNQTIEQFCKDNCEGKVE